MKGEWEMKKKMALLLCLVLVLTSVFAGCSNANEETTTPPPTPEGTTEVTTEGTTEATTEATTEEVTEPPFNLFHEEMGLLKQVEDNGRLYTVAGCVMNGAGEVVLELPGGNTPTYINDVITGQPRAFTISVGALEGSGVWYDDYYSGWTHDLLYDANGKLLSDRPTSWGFQCFGDWIMDFAPLIHGSGGGDLVDMKTDTLILSNVGNYDFRDFGLVVVSDNTAYVYDTAHNLTASIADVEHGYFAENGYLQLYGLDGLCRFYDMQGNLLSDALSVEADGLGEGSSYVTFGDYVAYTGFDGPRMKNVYTGEIIAFPDYAGCTISNIYQDQVILSRPWDYAGDDRCVLVDFAGNVLTPWFRWLNCNNYYEPVYYNGTFATGENVWFLPDRTEIFRCTDDDGVYVEIISEDLYVVTGHASWIDDVYEAGYAKLCRVGQDEPIIDTGIYETIANYDYWGGDRMGQHLFGVRQAASGMMLYDMLDMNGNVIVSSLKSYRADDSRIVAQQGFYEGLMDWNGDWIYRTSAFYKLDDEY